MSQDNSKYSVLLMRDDGHVRRFRFRSSWLKIIVWTASLLVIFSIGGTWGAIHYWIKAGSMDAQLTEYERRNTELVLKLERLQNMETIIGTSEKVVLAPVLDTGPVAAIPPKPPVETATEHETINNATSAIVVAAVPEQKNATLPAPAENASAPLFVDMPNDPQALEPGPIRVENISVKPNSAKTVRLNMTLVNVSTKPVNGYATASLITAAGEVPITAPSDDLSFQMSRLKRVGTIFPLPEGVSKDDVQALRINIFVDGKQVMTQTEAIKN